MGKGVMIICIVFVVLDFCWYLYKKYVKYEDFENYFDYMKNPFKYRNKNKEEQKKNEKK